MISENLEDKILELNKEIYDLGSKPLRFSKQELNKLNELGINGLAIILFHEKKGPYLAYYYRKNSKLVSDLLRNSALSVEMSVIAKYAKEVILKNDSRIMIKEFRIKKERTIPNFFVIQLKSNYKKAEIRRLLDSISKRLSKLKDFEKEEVENILRDEIRRFLSI